MRLVKLTRCDGKEILFNPARVLDVEAARAGEGGSDIHHSGGTHEFEDDTRVTESPKEIAGLVLEPLR